MRRNALPKLLGLILLVAAIAPQFSLAETEDGEYRSTAENCVSVEDPKACMVAYGYRCHQSRSLHKSLDAKRIGCNRPLGDGRMHFAQMAYDDGSWVIERQHSYLPDIVEDPLAWEDPRVALSSYLGAEMGDFSVVASGGIRTWRRAEHFSFEAGAGREGGARLVRAVCGAIILDPRDDTLASAIQLECERALLRTIRKLSQVSPSVPFRAAGANEIGWQTRAATLVSGDHALILVGLHVFQPEGKPCVFVSGCCSPDGAIYLMSCRTPTDADRRAIESCLERQLPPRTEEFLSCLSEQQVKVGCVNQLDGSRLCY